MRKISVGLIGAGRIGKIHGENMKKLPYVYLKAISDVQVESITMWAHQLQTEIITDHYVDILDDSDIEAVFICSPTTTHGCLIKEAALKGKHIFCEKPISFDLEQTKEVLKVVEEAGIHFQVGFHRRFDPHFRHVHELVKQGVLGEPSILKITSRDPEPPSPSYVQMSGGLFIDMSIHDFDMARYIMGSNVVEVFSQGNVSIEPQFRQLEDIDTAIVTLTFANGAMGVIDNSRKAVYGYDQRLELLGSKACIAVDNVFPYTTQIMNAQGIHRDKPLPFFLERYKDAYMEEITSFFNSILWNKPVFINGNDGLQAELIAHACKKSFTEKRPINLSSG